MIGAVLLIACAAFPIGYSAHLESPQLFGVLHDNISNREGQGSGFKPLALRAFPNHNIFRDQDVGLNFEHVFNGTRADRDISMFTPRRDHCTLEVLASNRVSLHWPAEQSTWGMDCRMTYTLEGDGVSMTFEATPRQDRFPLGYCAMMWASYMHRTRERAIHFLGESDGRVDWLSFGVDLPGGGFETGTIASAGVAPLPFEEGAQTLNVLEHPTRRFTEPFYYGLIDGDGNLASTSDTFAYIMAFDQTEPIRFALWNFVKDDNGKSDPHSPAWDWQYVIRNPEIGHTYTYRARLIIRPYTTREDIIEAAARAF